jgi:tRNA A37 threonylcarbamoyladenosine dehydratase
MTDLDEQQLSRTIALIGDDAVCQLAESRVALVGDGAALAHAALHLARSGVGHIQIVARRRHVTSRDLQLNPAVRRIDVVEHRSVAECIERCVAELWRVSRVRVESVESIDDLFHGRANSSSQLQAVAICDDFDDNHDDLLPGHIRLCVANDVPVIAVVEQSWRGATDVTRLRVSGVADAGIDDCAARRVRRQLLRHDVRHRVALIHANEPVTPVTPVTTAMSFGAVVATTLGSVVASQVMACVAHHMPLEWCDGVAPGFPMFVRDAHSTFCARSRGTTQFALSLRQVEYIIDCMWNQRSAWSRRAGKLYLALVDAAAPASECNVVPLLDDELKLFNNAANGLALFSAEQRAFVDAVFEHEQSLSR